MLYDPHFTLLYTTMQNIWKQYSDNLASLKVTWKPIKNSLGDIVQYLPDIEIRAKGVIL